MVLYKRKMVEIPPPSSPLPEEGDEVWFIPITNEYFSRYEDYLARMDFFKRRKFICELTGHSCLTYFEAYESEMNETKQIMNNFPEALKEPILRKIQFSQISRLDALVDDVYNSLKHDFFPGEVVIAKIKEQRIKVVVREKAKFNSITLPTGEVRPAYSKLRVQMIANPAQEMAVDDSQLTRDRKVFTKVILRTFIKHAVSREAWSGAPWIVKDEYAKAYKIDQTVPWHLQRAKHPDNATTELQQQSELPNTVASNTITNASQQQLSFISSSGPPKKERQKPGPKPKYPPIIDSSQPIFHHQFKQQNLTNNSQHANSNNNNSNMAGLQIHFENGSANTPLKLQPIAQGKEEYQEQQQQQLLQEQLQIQQEIPDQQQQNVKTKHQKKGPPGKKPQNNETVEPPGSKQTNGAGGPGRKRGKQATNDKAVPIDTRPKIEEDLNLPLVTAKERKLNGQAPLPMMKKEQSLTNEENNIMGTILEVWLFLNVYHEPLVLDTFTFDDFIDALRLADEETECSLIDEIHCALLSCVVGEDKADILVTLPAEEDSEEEDGDDEDDASEQQEKKEEKEESEKDSTTNGHLKDTIKEEEEGEEHDGEDDNDVEMADVTKDGDEKVHKGTEFSKFQKIDWTERLRRRMFKDGGWQQILIGLLNTISYVEEWHEMCESSLQQLASLNRPVTLTSALIGYYHLPFIRKIGILDILCKLLHDSNLVRGYIDKCLEESVKIRREKNDKQREYKLLVETLKGFEEEKKKNFFPNGYGNEQENQKPGETTADTRKRLKLEKEEELAKEDSSFKKIYEQMDESNKKMESINELMKEYDENLMKLDCQRMKILGKDRYHNRYWWFEYNGRVRLDKEEQENSLKRDNDAEENDDDNSSSRRKTRNESESDSEEENNSTGYTMGRLWVQGPMDEEAEAYLEYSKNKDDIPNVIETEDGDIWSNGELLMNSDKELVGGRSLKPIELKKLEEGEYILKGLEDWSYYDKPQDIENLLNWLDKTGRRELKLLKEIEAVKDRIILSMRSRKEDLDADHAIRNQEIESMVEEEEEEFEKERKKKTIKEEQDDDEENGEEQDEAEEDSDDIVPRKRRRSSRRSSGKKKAATTVKQEDPDVKEARKQQFRERIEKEMENRIPQRVLEWNNSLAIEKLGHTHYESQKKRSSRKTGSRKT